jgi:hypothetical protein
MAARIRDIKHDERTREKIKTSQLVNRLTKHALSDVEIMTTSQVHAAAVVLKKSLPDLTSTDVKVDGKLIIEINDHWAKISKS